MKIKCLIKRELYIEFRISFISDIISVMKSIKYLTYPAVIHTKFVIHYELNAVVGRESE